MTEDQDAKETQSDSGVKTFVNKNRDKKMKAQRPLTKIILRRLPPTMTEEAFLEQVSPIPEHDHFYFAKPDTSLGNNLYSRAYINFVNVDDIYLFRDKFDGYVFLDERGVEYVGIVEYAPFQRIPKKKKKKDPKCGTIESDPVYQEFIESLNKDPDTENQPKLEYSYPVNDSNEKKVQSTPLLEYLAARKQDKRSRDERRRRENDKRKMRIERKTKDMPLKEEDNGDNEVKRIKTREWEKDKFIESRDDQTKDDNYDGNVYESKNYRDQRNVSSLIDKRKKSDNDKIDGSAKDNEQVDDNDNFRKDKRDKNKDSPREQKSKKYSDTRKERIKLNEYGKSERQSMINKIISSENKTKTLSDDIKPFTQLPHVKTDDLTKIIDGLDKKVKLEEKYVKVSHREVNDDPGEGQESGTLSRIRVNSLDSEEASKEDFVLNRQMSFNERSKSTDREGSEEKDKIDNAERRAERRIRNKDRPSLVIYQPGMGKFSKQRLAKEKDTQPLNMTRAVNDGEKKDT